MYVCNPYVPLCPYLYHSNFANHSIRRGRLPWLSFPKWRIVATRFKIFMKIRFQTVISIEGTHFVFPLVNSGPREYTGMAKKCGDSCNGITESSYWLVNFLHRRPASRLQPTRSLRIIEYLTPKTAQDRPLMAVPFLASLLVQDSAHIYSW